MEAVANIKQEALIFKKYPTSHQCFGPHLVSSLVSLYQFNPSIRPPNLIKGPVGDRWSFHQ